MMGFLMEHWDGSVKSLNSEDTVAHTQCAIIALGFNYICYLLFSISLTMPLHIRSLRETLVVHNVDTRREMTG